MQQHPFQISRKIEYAMRAMIFLASQPLERMVPFREIARRMDVPEDFLAKILKTLVERNMVRSTRGASTADLSNLTEDNRHDHDC